MTDQPRTERSPSGLERFLGGSPGGVVIRLLLLSLVVGFLMSVFGIDVREVLQGAFRLVRETLRDGAGVFRSLVGYVLAGAAIVVPVWLVIRLTKGR